MRRVLVLMFLVLGLSAGEVVSQTVSKMVPIQADVDTLYRLADGKLVRTSARYYRSSSGQTRDESSVGAVITDVAAGTITILVAETKEARVVTIPAEQRTRPVRSNRPSPEVFEETTIDGNRVSKARTEGPQGEKLEVWTAKDLGVVVRTRVELGGAVTTKELHNISQEEPKSDLFTIPADYTIIRQEAMPENGNPGLPPRPGRKPSVPQRP